MSIVYARQVFNYSLKSSNHLLNEKIKLIPLFLLEGLLSLGRLLISPSILIRSKLQDIYHSEVSNKRAGWNKQTGLNFVPFLIIIIKQGGF